MKSYEVKLYSRIWVFKKTINPRLITSQFDFSEDLEWGQWDLTLSLSWDFWEFLCTDIIEIREVDDTNKAISRTYTGIIEEISIQEFEKKDIITIQLLWVFTALNDIIFKQWGNREFTVTMTPGNLVKAIIDHFNSVYWTLSGWNTQNLTTNLIRYTASSIDVTWSAVNYSFDNDTCLDALRKTLDSKGFSFFIWSDGICYVQQDVNQSKVGLTMGRQVVQIERKIHKRELVNTLYHERNLNNEQTYTDPVSITLFWTKEKKEVDTEILDATTQNTYWAKFISEHAYERNEISILVKPQQSESITPGMLVTINNIKTPLVDKKITKITKNRESWIIYVWDFVSFWKEILKK